MAHQHQRLFWVIKNGVLFGLYQMRIRLTLLGLCQIGMLLCLNTRVVFYGQTILPGMTELPVKWLVMLVLPLIIIGDMPRRVIFYYYPRFLPSSRGLAMLLTMVCGMLSNVLPVGMAAWGLIPISPEYTLYLIAAQSCILIIYSAAVMLVSPMVVQAIILAALIAAVFLPITTPLSLLMLVRFTAAAAGKQFGLLLGGAVIVVVASWYYLGKVDYEVLDGKDSY
ncbi:hypothetical protein [Lacticaseibacillus hulanensis]|uniref:hypothetical protein n=1 Tax=Lacticaseibacillus hulanensis TaxID=2493111 RepID=UPI000FDA88AE|nr:hypothetical protein [Lacticaseibacillus hulanensis]